MAEEQYRAVQLAALERIVPTKKERARLKKEYQQLLERITALLADAGIEARIEKSGSYARDTWLAGSRDIDIFIVLPYDSDQTPEMINELLQKNIVLPWVKKHANHPYLHAIKDDLKIDLVPCYEYKCGEEMLSAVDRSPEHKKFIQEQLPVGANDEVRLLKQFFKAIGVYGAEIKTHGFSGFLTELLIIHFNGTFLNVLKNAHTLPGKVITFKENLSVRAGLFSEDSFVVVDPTDDQRNVASPVSQESLERFVAAAQAYLRNPSEKFFFPKKITYDQAKKKALQKTPLTITGVLINKPLVSPDILWGQLRRFETGLFELLTKKKLAPITINSFTGEKTVFTFIISKNSHTPTSRWQKGPPITNKEQEAFLTKYLQKTTVLHGPRIHQGRWWVLLAKQAQPVKKIIQEAIERETIPLPSHLALNKETPILEKEPLLERLAGKKEQLIFLYKLLQGKPNYYY